MADGSHGLMEVEKTVLETVDLSGDEGVIKEIYKRVNEVMEKFQAS